MAASAGRSAAIKTGRVNEKERFHGEVVEKWMVNCVIRIGLSVGACSPKETWSRYQGAKDPEEVGTFILLEIWHRSKKEQSRHCGRWCGIWCRLLYCKRERVFRRL